MATLITSKGRIELDTRQTVHARKIRLEGHALDRLAERGITKGDALAAAAFPQYTRHAGERGVRKHIRWGITAIVQSDGVVRTVYRAG